MSDGAVGGYRWLRRDQQPGRGELLGGGVHRPQRLGGLSPLHLAVSEAVLNVPAAAPAAAMTGRIVVKKRLSRTGTSGPPAGPAWSAARPVPPPATRTRCLPDDHVEDRGVSLHGRDDPVGHGSGEPEGRRHIAVGLHRVTGTTGLTSAEFAAASDVEVRYAHDQYVGCGLTRRRLPRLVVALVGEPVGSGDPPAAGQPTILDPVDVVIADAAEVTPLFLPYGFAVLGRCPDDPQVADVGDHPQGDIRAVEQERNRELDLAEFGLLPVDQAGVSTIGISRPVVAPSMGAQRTVGSRVGRVADQREIRPHVEYRQATA